MQLRAFGVGVFAIFAVWLLVVDTPEALGIGDASRLRYLPAYLLGVLATFVAAYLFRRNRASLNAWESGLFVAFLVAGNVLLTLAVPVHVDGIWVAVTWAAEVAFPGDPMADPGTIDVMGLYTPPAAPEATMLVWTGTTLPTTTTVGVTSRISIFAIRTNAGGRPPPPLRAAASSVVQPPAVVSSHPDAKTISKLGTKVCAAIFQAAD
ncbi:MAG: hypothetical protein IH899_16300 [Planctomycetes bacterium]|nr:hypothetical protein [Planctomycetota bacterium]